MKRIKSYCKKAWNWLTDLFKAKFCPLPSVSGGAPTIDATFSDEPKKKKKGWWNLVENDILNSLLWTVIVVLGAAALIWTVGFVAGVVHAVWVAITANISAYYVAQSASFAFVRAQGIWIPGRFITLLGYIFIPPLGFLFSGMRAMAGAFVPVV
jgi:hypothetical protein